LTVDDSNIVYVYYRLFRSRYVASVCAEVSLQWRCLDVKTVETKPPFLSLIEHAVLGNERVCATVSRDSRWEESLHAGRAQAVWRLHSWS